MVIHPSILLIEESPGECELSRLALVQAGLDAAAAFHFLEDHVHHFRWSL